MIIHVRLETALAQSGLSQSELARRVGISQPAIAHLLSGRSTSSVHLLAIASELGVSVAYLQGLTDDPKEGFVPVMSDERVTEKLDLQGIKEIDLAYGLGGQYLDVQAVQESTVWFPGAFLRQYTKSAPEHLRFCRGDGDSMVPTIGHHDIVLFDMSQNHLNRQNAIWVVAVADIGMIKRVRAEPDGSYVLMSDNKLVDPQVVVDGEMHVIGRVVAVIRGM